MEHNETDTQLGDDISRGLNGVDYHVGGPVGAMNAVSPSRGPRNASRAIFALNCAV
jgi:hypothetical protein